MIWWLSLRENFRRLKLLPNFMLWLYMAGVAIMAVGLGIIGAVLEGNATLLEGLVIAIIGLALTAIPSYRLGKLGPKHIGKRKR